MRQVGILRVCTGQKAIIYENAEYGDFQVNFYDEGGRRIPGASYHTDDEEDARGTARAELERMKAQD